MRTMIKKKFSLLSLLIFSVVHPLTANTTSRFQEGMQNDLNFIDFAFQDFYAAAEWKKEYLGWSLESEIASAKQKIVHNRQTDLKLFHRTIKELFASAKDYHVFVYFYSTESATLPFRVRGAEGRYFFSFVDRDGIVEEDFPFTEGDELLTFNGISIDAVIKEFKETEIGDNHELTDHALAEMHLTERLGMLGHTVPRGNVILKGRKKESKEELFCSVDWNYTSEKMTPPPLKSMCVPEKNVQRGEPRAIGYSQKSRLDETALLADASFFKKKSVFSQYEALSKFSLEGEEEKDVLGSKKSFLPPLGEVLWESDEDSIFHAYLFSIPGGKNVGYIRIPSYSPEDLDGALKEFSALLKSFNLESDMLVIDQVNNPGGYLLYVYALASMLTDQPLSIPKHRMMLSQSDVFFAHEHAEILEAIESDSDAILALGESLQGLEINYQLSQSLLSYFKFIISQWNEGKRFTDPFYLYGIGPLPSNEQVNYTKPILVLVNSLDFSGGDFFPAILQDSRRAKIFGARTAGAGGVVEGISFPNLRGIAAIYYTTSIAEREGAFLIENQGVSPDIPYQVSAFDLQNNYENYVQQVVKTLQEM